MTLDQALDEFHKNPTSETATAFNKAISEARQKGLLGKDMFNGYFEEVAMFFLIQEPIIYQE